MSKSPHDLMQAQVLAVYQAAGIIMTCRSLMQSDVNADIRGVPDALQAAEKILNTAASEIEELSDGLPTAEALS